MTTLQGIVTKSTGSWYTVKAADGQLFDCRIRGKLRLMGSKSTNPVAVGDSVSFVNDARDGAVITERLERRNYIIRKATNLSRQTHVLAANLDQALLVVTLFQPRISLGFIDRFLLTAEAYDIPCTVVFNKTDLWGAEAEAVFQDICDIYKPSGYRISQCSAQSGKGLEELAQWLQGKTSLVSGFSGVGKSSLLNALYPGLSLKTGEISDYSQKGKHTTTFAELFEPNPGTRIIDSPGIKELGIIDIEGYELAHHFPEMRPFINQCKFNTCTHTHEPGCAVRTAVELGAIAPERYKSYLSILSNEDQYN
ncbi:MAG: ribosome small subunit-dependent GTPase A [Bacteroidia bacterium]